MAVTTYFTTQMINLGEPSAVTTNLATTFTLDASRFTPRDLSLFMESLETISRIERERHERKERRREQKVQRERVSKLLGGSQHSICTSPTPSADEAEDEPVLYMEAKLIPQDNNAKKGYQSNASSDNDEAYSSGQNSPRHSVSYCSCGGFFGTSNGSLRQLQSDSEPESGVFNNCQHSSSSLHIYDQVPPLRPRSSPVITKPKHRSTRSRIISMVLKREYAKAPSSQSLEEQAERCERLLNETIQHRYENLPSLPPCNKQKTRKPVGCDIGTPEERFLAKALRYLTL